MLVVIRNASRGIIFTCNEAAIVSECIVRYVHMEIKQWTCIKCIGRPTASYICHGLSTLA